MGNRVVIYFERITAPDIFCGAFVDCLQTKLYPDGLEFIKPAKKLNYFVSETVGARSD